jgi:nitric-oxide synthase
LNSLEVRDCRHIDTPEGIVHEIEKHLEIATAGTNLQGVMTVFQPRGPDEPWSIRFWSNQQVRYACCTDKDDPTKTMGDTANKQFTKFLIEKRLWTPPPPEKRTQHDVLPIVFKIPGRDEQYMHQFDDKYVDEVSISHPEYPEVSKLGHRWAAVPAISSFNDTF